jgi:formate/nitrite transporter FocA (FNT family)
MMAIMQGAPATFKQVIWNNLIPATIGNWIGGALLMATIYSYIYGNPNLKLNKDRFY